MKTLILFLVFAGLACAQMTVCRANATGTVIDVNAQQKPICFVISQDAVKAMNDYRSGVSEVKGGVIVATYPTNWLLVKKTVENKLSEILAQHPPAAIQKLKTAAATAADEVKRAVDATPVLATTEQ